MFRKGKEVYVCVCVCVCVYPTLPPDLGLLAN